MSGIRLSPYPLLLLGGIAVTFFTWSRIARRDERLVAIYLTALAGAFLGAKVVYLAAEGWMFRQDPNRWVIWATGKTVLGALLGGYAAVEAAKAALGYRAPTGDLFALVVPAGIVMGRIGCLLHGCCLGKQCPAAWWTASDAQGIARWPAAAVELAFNAAALAFFVLLQRLPRNRMLAHSISSAPRPGAHPFPGQHFHLYLIAYGLFRFLHELMRETPRLASGLSGYQIAALAVAGLGVVGYLRRQRAKQAAAVS